MAAPKAESVITKIIKFGKLIKHHGGIVQSIRTLYRMDVLKFGNLVGEDKHGNKYYENDYYFLGKNRWVVYTEKVNLEFDASQVPAEWHRWLHNTTDKLPSEELQVKRDWFVDHKQNYTGTSKKYVPFSTTKPKIEAWDPTKKA